MRPERDLAVTWRSYCLEIRDDYGVAPTVPEHLRDAALAGHACRHRMLRIFEAARARAGEEAVDALYTEWGRAVLRPGRPARRRRSCRSAWRRAVSIADLLDAADDDRWDAPIVEAMEVAYAFGGPKTQTPTIVVRADPPYGFKGPVMAPAPTGEAAARLWDAVQVIAGSRGSSRSPGPASTGRFHRFPTDRGAVSAARGRSAVSWSTARPGGVGGAEHPGGPAHGRGQDEGDGERIDLWECTMSTAPTTAPANMATTVSPRRPARAPLRPPAGRRR